MSNNDSPRIDIKEINISTRIILPRCPQQIQLEGGGCIATKALSVKTLRNIGKLWTDELIRKAKEQRKLLDDDK